MSEEWIRKLADEQKRAEVEQNEHQRQLAAVTEQQSFDAAVAPFFSAVRDELQRCATEYNEAMGREDLTIAAEPERGMNAFVIYRGDRHWIYCEVDLDKSSHEVVVSYSAPFGIETDPNTTKSMKFEVVHGEGGVRAVIDDGTPFAVAKAILSEWASYFPSTPPESP